jgi:hypothetical protein
MAAGSLERGTPPRQNFFDCGFSRFVGRALANGMEMDKVITCRSSIYSGPCTPKDCD